ncbi:TetR/AcrR family transcriptional regulator [Pseudonocardia sp. TRM90224]|uniref:TetR/AcrR family transcriptional regulator n=1 Tax=Pseudonocardia sp. TRM90224 TaxID=2812678 RepID=UPI001E5A225F|nr:TetR/AcrR family transcriptional regulator [Pseudonocardia sp. TRM90224]
MAGSGGRSDDRPLLPVAGQPVVERADAARNRVALLTAAAAILERDGVDALSMDRVAAEARVGVGTVYRRFGDRGGLAFALLDDDERRFQEAFLSGRPPLGPGAPPQARIRAFVHSYIDRLESHGELHAVAEIRTATARFASGAYRTARAHIVALLHQVDPRGDWGDHGYLADALLALVDAGLFLYQRRELGYSLERIKAGVDVVVDGLLGERRR